MALAAGLSTRGALSTICLRTWQLVDVCRSPLVRTLRASSSFMFFRASAESSTECAVMVGDYLWLAVRQTWLWRRQCFDINIGTQKEWTENVSFEASISTSTMIPACIFNNGTCYILEHGAISHSILVAGIVVTEPPVGAWFQATEEMHALYLHCHRRKFP